LDDEPSDKSAAHNVAASTGNGNEARVRTLCDWLMCMAMIGHDPIQEEMES
jgi:hypothetical protein